MLRALVRRDVPPTASHVQYLLENMHNNHSSIKYVSAITSWRYVVYLSLQYAQRAVIKVARNIKHVRYCPTTEALIAGNSVNPLVEDVNVTPSHEFTLNFLASYKIPLDKTSNGRPPYVPPLVTLVFLPIFIRSRFFYDRDPGGWLAWSSSMELYKAPKDHESTFQPWDNSTQEATSTIKKFAMDPEWWGKLSSRYAEETDETSVSLDHVSCIKSICERATSVSSVSHANLVQLFDDGPLELVKPIIVTLLENKTPDKQRAAAELLAGIIGGATRAGCSVNLVLNISRV